MESLTSYLRNIRVDQIFDVHSGDYHATEELDTGAIPLISCGDIGNGVVGYFDIPEENRYKSCLTVAYNGSPILTKFHPYEFGAKDDVAVLLPNTHLQESTLLYIAACLNRISWRYSYGRKCFRKKLQAVKIPVPVREKSSSEIDEEKIARLFSVHVQNFIPRTNNNRPEPIPRNIRWHEFNITELFELKRGDFHSLSILGPGEHMTISRVSDDNGVVGYFEKPDEAIEYSKGHLTISTVGGDAFVQLDDFIATDNVIVCTPLFQLSLETLFFIAFILNRQKWRYGYGRQCYMGKLKQVNIALPVKSGGTEIDEDLISRMVRQTSHWNVIADCFKKFDLPIVSRTQEFGDQRNLRL